MKKYYEILKELREDKEPKTNQKEIELRGLKKEKNTKNTMKM